MHSLYPLENEVSKSWPPADWQDVGVVLAVSGGADSVALTRTMAGVRIPGAGRLSVAHFNHHLRGTDSQADQQFVQDLCRRLALECVVGHGDESGPETTGDGLEAACRAARYAFLQQAAEALGARYVVTAHTADDQAETVLHHVLRGSGLAGLAGMARTRPLGPAVTLMRPMLGVRRHEVLAYLKDLDQPFRHDQSNLDPRFTRNRIRHELLPLIAREYSAAVVESLVRLSALAADVQRVVERAAERLLESAVIEEDAWGVVLHCPTFAAQDRHLVRESFVSLWRRQGWPLQDMGYAQWNLLADLAVGERSEAACSRELEHGTHKQRCPSFKRVFPGSIMVERRGQQLALCADAAPQI
jgi:tRNA(Ile)-lysidine synthase